MTLADRAHLPTHKHLSSSPNSHRAPARPAGHPLVTTICPPSRPAASSLRPRLSAVSPSPSIVTVQAGHHAEFFAASLREQQRQLRREYVTAVEGGTIHAAEQVLGSLGFGGLAEGAAEAIVHECISRQSASGSQHCVSRCGPCQDVRGRRIGALHTLHDCCAAGRQRNGWDNCRCARTPAGSACGSPTVPGGAEHRQNTDRLAVSAALALAKLGGFHRRPASGV